jgi:2-keto-4-pentenoate hydratase/2-oxohepta-3-ene-1,7-dioic acid hydratase in catechol pathway
MRLVTYTYRGTTRLGAMLGEREVLDLARADPRLPSDMLAFLAAGEPALAGARSALAAARAGKDRDAAVASGLLFSLDEPGCHLEAPVPRPGKVLAVGVNYRDHASEAKMDLPSRPMIFAKVTTCVNRPGGPIHKPRVSDFLDWEGELCFVVGKRARHVPAAAAMEHVAGFMVGNDVTVRDWQAHSRTMMMGKGFDTHGPIGPWLVTRDEVPDPHALDLKTWVNGVLKQDSNTRHLIFGVPALVEYLSQAFTLEPGDVVFTGTPSGVGFARDPREWMKHGDVVRVEIAGIGALENPVVNEP